MKEDDRAWLELGALITKRVIEHGLNCLSNNKWRMVIITSPTPTLTLTLNLTPTVILTPTLTLTLTQTLTLTHIAHPRHLSFTLTDHVVATWYNRVP